MNPNYYQDVEDPVLCTRCGHPCHADDAFTDGTIALCGSLRGNGCADESDWLTPHLLIVAVTDDRGIRQEWIVQATSEINAIMFWEPYAMRRWGDAHIEVGRYKPGTIISKDEGRIGAVVEWIWDNRGNFTPLYDPSGPVPFPKPRPTPEVRSGPTNSNQERTTQ